MIVPPESMEQICRRRGSDRFEDCDVSLRRDVPTKNNPNELPCSGRQEHVEQRGPCSCRGDSGPLASPPLVSARPDPPSPRPGNPRRLSPLDVALVGQEVIEDAEARGGLQVPEAHGGPHAAPAPTATAAGKGRPAPAPALYSAGIPARRRTQVYSSARASGELAPHVSAAPAQGVQRTGHQRCKKVSK